MNISKLAKKAFQVSRGFTYNYYTHPAQSCKPTIILFHGWPDTALLWAGFINSHLIPHGYGVVALDCLGYGGTSKPTDKAAYAWQHMTADAIEILDAENVSSVISMGHDWGSSFCQRLYNFYPSRVIGLVMVNVSYFPPTGDFNLDTVNAVTRHVYGNGIFEYWNFFVAEDAVDVMNQNLESVYTVCFSDPYTWLDNFCTPGGMRKYITEGRTQPTLPIATPEHRAEFMERFGRDGLTGPAADALVVKVPVLYWGGNQDFVCRPMALQPSIDAGLVPNLKSITTEGGHWALLEKPEEFGQDVVEWLEMTFEVER